MEINKLFTEEQKKWNEAYDDEVDDISRDLNELYMEIVEIRKGGRDPLVAEYNYMMLKSKLRYVKAAKNRTAIDEIKKKIDELKQEIKEAKEQEIVDVKKEFTKMLKDNNIHYIGEIENEEVQ